MNEAQPQVTLENIGELFGRLLAQSFALQTTQANQIELLQSQVAILADENRDLRERVNDTELALLEAQGKAIIREAKEKPPVTAAMNS